jgi:hypothetical protein
MQTMPDKLERLQSAIVAAELFIKRAEHLLDLHERGECPVYCGSAQSGAVKRASLELTRALSAYRKP